MTGEAKATVAARAREWHRARQDLICDQMAPWDHGTIMRASRYPSYWDFNLVQVEGDPEMSVEALIAVADHGLAGLPHRRIDFSRSAAADALRGEFEARGWSAVRIVFMRHEIDRPGLSEVAVEEVPYDAVDGLRLAWHQEDFPGASAEHLASAREVSLLRNARVFAVSEGNEVVAFAQVEHAGGSAEIAQVYVHPERRGHGLGTSLTRAAITSARLDGDLWIAADDEGRPKHLYSRLGFRPAWTTTELTLMPAQSA